MAIAPAPSSALVARFAAGSESAFAGLHARHYQFAFGLARRRLGRAFAGSSDPDTVADSVFLAVWREARGESRLRSGLTDTASFLALVGMLTAQKVGRVLQFEQRKRRDIGRLVRPADRPSDQCPLADISTPDTDQVLPMDDLPADLTDRQRQIVGLAVQGWTNAEMAAYFGCHVRSVERDRQIIRALWPAD